jgi:predicted phage replisome organizer
MSEVKWVKLSTQTFTVSRKIKDIERLPQGDTIIVIWMKLLCLAGEINDGGAIYITPGRPFSRAALAEELRKPLKIVEKALDIFDDYGMTETVDGIIYLSSWAKYQNLDRLAEIREYNREAQRRSRAKKAAEREEDVNDNVNDKSMTSQRCQDTEEEEEGDIDKESHSIIHSIGSEVAKKEGAKRRFFGGKLGKGVVLLSEDQVDSLLSQLSVEEFDKYIEIVADCELNGRRFKKKTHYKAILEMATADRRAD